MSTPTSPSKCLLICLAIRIGGMSLDHEKRINVSEVGRLFDASFDTFFDTDDAGMTYSELTAEGHDNLAYDTTDGNTWAHPQLARQFIRSSRPDIELEVCRIFGLILKHGTPGKPREHVEAELHRDFPAMYEAFIEPELGFGHRPR